LFLFLLSPLLLLLSFLLLWVMLSLWLGATNAPPPHVVHFAQARTPVNREELASLGKSPQ
jgi:hypothetical protein